MSQQNPFSPSPMTSSEEPSIDTPQIRLIENEEWSDETYTAGTVPDEVNDRIADDEFLEDQ